MISAWLNSLPVSRKFSTGVLWNIMGLALAGTGFILINILIVRFYNVAVLGVFNQVYAVYILLSQLAVAGIHFSVLKNIPQYADDENETARIFVSALLMVVGSAVLVAGFCSVLRSPVALFLDSPDVAEGLKPIIPALVFFSLNKVFMAYLNGLRKMKAYSIFLTLRVSCYLLILIGMIFASFPGHQLTYLFLGGEITLFLLMTGVYCKEILKGITVFDPRWIKRHLPYGLKAMFGNTFQEVNTRIDVLMLGVFTGDHLVGIYSFAAVLIEGYQQLAIVMRTNVNPIITAQKYQQGDRELEAFIRKGIQLFYQPMVILGMVSVLLFPLLIKILRLKSGLMDGLPVYAVLMAGSLIAIGYRPFDMLLTQCGHPGWQTVFFVATCFFNIVFNLILIPIWGIYGAAIATAMAFVVQMVLLRGMARSVLNLKI